MGGVRKEMRLERDKKKQNIISRWQLYGGDEVAVARHNLGNSEIRVGNWERAVG